MRNDFKPGDALATESELILQLKVSRPVLREALKMLGTKGLIETRPKVGTRVRLRAEWNPLDPDVIAWQSESEPDLSFLLNICEVRLMFEPMTAGLAATRATDEEIVQIAQSCQALLEAVDSAESYIAADLQFHTDICAAAHNEFLSSIISILDVPLRTSRRITSQLPVASQRSMPVHQTVSEAIQRRDGRTAEEAMREVVLLVIEDIRQTFASNQE